MLLFKISLLNLKLLWIWAFCVTSSAKPCPLSHNLVAIAFAFEETIPMMCVYIDVLRTPDLS
jgi:hypothetical protein